MKIILFEYRFTKKKLKLTWQLYIKVFEYTDDVAYGVISFKVKNSDKKETLEILSLQSLDITNYLYKFAKVPLNKVFLKSNSKLYVKIEDIVITDNYQT